MIISLKKNSIVQLVNAHLIDYPTPFNISHWWNFGFFSQETIIERGEVAIIVAGGLFIVFVVHELQKIRQRTFRYYDVSIVFLNNVDTLQIKYKGSTLCNKKIEESLKKTALTLLFLIKQHSPFSYVTINILGNNHFPDVNRHLFIEVKKLSNAQSWVLDVNFLESENQNKRLKFLTSIWGFVKSKLGF